MANTYKNAKVDLTTTDVTDVYTATQQSSTVANNATAVIKSILVSNDQGSASTITLTIGTAISLFKVKSVAANTTEELLSQPLVLMPGDILKATAADANRLHITISLLEIT
tara:strand:+ start:452 stop:784 length:333 start_codon:yes stop_codon:yes gene_type:complete